jgi:hypothetical protein
MTVQGGADFFVRINEKNGEKITKHTIKRNIKTITITITKLVESFDQNEVKNGWLTTGLHLVN